MLLINNCTETSLATSGLCRKTQRRSKLRLYEVNFLGVRPTTNDQRRSSSLLPGDNEFRRPQQRPLNLAVRKTANCVACQRRVLHRTSICRFERAVALQDRDNFAVSDAFECALL